MALPKKGMLTTVNICGRQYILPAEIARFNQRAAAGEFAKIPNPPPKRLLSVDNTASESRSVSRGGQHKAVGDSLSTSLSTGEKI
jgi:hypothetical protein